MEKYFQLNEVKAGGRTVFPRVGAGVKPVEGSAVFWYNLHESGDPDKLTLHGACPVLYGTKWGKYVFHVFLAYRNNSEDDTGSAQDVQHISSYPGDVTTNNNTILRIKRSILDLC